MVKGQKKAVAVVLPTNPSIVLDPEAERNRNATISEIRNLLEKEIKGGAVGMVRSAIAGVNNGQYLGMKYLFEMVGIHPSSADDQSPGEESLASILLRHFGVSDPSLPQDTVTKDSSQRSDREKDHIVE